MNLTKIKEILKEGFEPLDRWLTFFRETQDTAELLELLIQVQQVQKAPVGLEPTTSRLWAWRADHCATVLGPLAFENNF